MAIRNLALLVAMGLFLATACSSEAPETATQVGNPDDTATAASGQDGDRKTNEPTSGPGGIIEELPSDGVEFSHDLNTENGGTVSIGAHAYEYLDTSSNFADTGQSLPGLQTYILIPEQSDASDLYSALFESVDSLEEVLESTEFSIDQINVFYLPVQGSFADQIELMGNEDIDLVGQAYDHDWSKRALDDICAYVSAESSCDGLSGGPYLVSTLTPIQPDDSDASAPDEFVLLDMGALQDRSSWKEIIDAYKAAVLEAQALSDISASTGQTLGATQLMQVIKDRITETSNVQFPEGLVMRTLTTTGGCRKNWNCRIVCEL